MKNETCSTTRPRFLKKTVQGGVTTALAGLSHYPLYRCGFSHFDQHHPGGFPIRFPVVCSKESPLPGPLPQTRNGDLCTERFMRPLKNFNDAGFSIRRFMNPPWREKYNEP